MFDRLLKCPKNNSFFLFGARGTGKTSVVRGIAGTLYIDLLNEDLFQRYLVDPQLLADELLALKKKPQWVVIDEIQRVPRLLNIVHQLIESKHKMRFVLTGSSSRRLKQKGVNLLAGRAWIRNLHPLSFLETGDEFNLDEAINWGSLPNIFSLKSISDKTDYLRSYCNTYIKTEIQEEQWVRKLEPFIKFLPIAAQMNGKPLNHSSIGRDIGAEAPTVKAYFEILEDTLLGFHLPSYHKSIRKQQREASKFYFFDTGIKKALQKTLSVHLTQQTSEWGFAFEHLVICEFHRLNDYFSKDFSFSYLLTKDGMEVDLIIERPGKKTAFVEIKSAKKIHAQDFRSLSDLAKECRAEAFVLSNDPLARTDNGIQLTHWQQGLKNIFEI
jgi:uncharacterized protein